MLNETSSLVAETHPRREISMTASPSPTWTQDRPMTSVAVLGLGSMGARIAARLQDADHAVTVWNRSHAAIDLFVAGRAVAVASSPREAAESADIVISIVTNDEASHSVWLDSKTGALQAAGDGVVVEMSTITPRHAKLLAREAASGAVGFVEAPVIGSRPHAESGTLIVLAGGDHDTVERIRPTLDAISSAIHHVGPAGTAATLKLAVNGLFAAQVAAFAEMTNLLNASDVDNATAQSILSGLPITSPAMQRVLALFATSNFAPNFPIRLVAKDLDYLRRSGAALGLELALVEHVSNLFGNAARSEAAELDISGIITTLS